MRRKTEVPHGQAEENMRPEEAARYVRVSTSKLAKLRMPANRNDGPVFVKLAGCVIYRKKDLDDWLERCRVTD